MPARDGRITGPGRTCLFVAMLAATLALPVAWPGTSGVAAAEPSPAGGGWQPVVVPDAPDPVLVVASGDGPNGLPLEPTFTFTRTDGGAPADLLPGLVADPAATFKDATGSGPDQLVVRPTEPLRRATEYRITATAPNGLLLGSWVFLTQGPPHIVRSLPDGWTDGVPVSTGIEITFDQPGISDIARYFTIDPATTGRFETHGRTVAFVPDHPLLPGTEYSIRIRAGLPVKATGERLESDWTTGFVTRRDGKRVRDIGAFPRVVAEASTLDAPLLPFNLSRMQLTTLPVQVHRLADLDAATVAVRAAQAVGTDWNDRLTLDTSDLEPVLAFDAPLRRTSPWDGSSRAFTLPAPLPAGWYVVTVTDPAGDASVVLQVTDLAVYSHVTTTRTAVWVNDLATGGPVRGTTVRLAGGVRLGATDAEGLLVAGTPAALEAATPRPLLIVRDGARAVLVPFGAGGWESGDVILDPESTADWAARSRYWSLLYTDRQQYRTTDTVDLWGLIRERDSDAVPTDVTVELRAEDDGGGTSVIAGMDVAPSSVGGYVASLALDDVPTGSYTATLRVDGTTVDEVWFEVAVIAKPAYRLTLEAAHRVYIAGEPLPLTATAAFFDGTAVPAVPLVVRGGGGSVRTSTDGRGTADARLTARPDRGSDGQWSTVEVYARPGRGEEGTGDATTDVLVFRSAVVLTAHANIDGRQATLTGSLAQVDRKRLEQQYDRAYSLAFDPRGLPVAGAAVRVRVIEETPVRTQDGTTYDYIQKKVVPVWRYDTREDTILTTILTTGAGGRYSLPFPVVRGHGYRVVLSAQDARGRTTSLDVYAQRPSSGFTDHGAYLTAEGGAFDWFYPHVQVRIGERFTVEMREGDAILPAGGDNRYLWLSSQRGLRSAGVEPDATHAWTFHAADAPMLEISAVRFTGETYIAAADAFAADFDPAQRDLTVTITPLRQRYEPGGTAAVDVSVTDQRGRPVVADVAMRATDEKLYAIGAASGQDPLDDLYRSVDTGTRLTYASHQVPRLGSRGEGGDTGTGGGGEARMDFRDQLLFRLARTGADGHATVSFDLSDDLTSWRVSGTAMSDRLQVGQGSVSVPVGLPFFVDLVMPPEVLAADQVAVRVRTYGRGLAAGDPVHLEVSAPSLGMTPVSIDSTAFTEVVVPLPAPTVGTHALTVAGSGPTADLNDRLTRTLTVVPSRLTAARSTWAPLDAPASPTGGAGINSFTVTDSGRGAAVSVLLMLTDAAGGRADQAIAAAEARRLLIEEFGMDPASLPEPALDRSQYQTPSGGIALLPYARADLELSAMVALAAPGSVDRDALEQWLRRVRDGAGGHIADRVADAMALAALAALGSPVVADVWTRVGQGPTAIEEEAWLAVAAAESGDLTTARSLQADVLERRGQAQGRYLRITASGGELSGRLTGLTAIVAARLGRLEIADAADRYLADEPPADAVTSLDRLATAVRRAAAVPAAAGRFAATVDGVRTEVTLDPGRSWSVALVPAQVAGFRLEPIDGSLLLASSWLEPLDPSSVRDDPAITVNRSVEPSGPVAAGAIVTVTLQVGLGVDALDGCYLVTDLAPSGLSPIRDARPWRDRGGILPWRIDGQRVTFCATRSATRPQRTLTYAARVVTPGVYTWEPTLVQSMTAPESRELGVPATIELQ